jgi:hypothetical protein
LIEEKYDQIHIMYTGDTHSQSQTLNSLRQFVYNHNFSEYDCKGSHNTFVETTLLSLNEYTKPWNMVWDVVDAGYNMHFFTKLCHDIALPFDLMVYLMDLISNIAKNGSDGSQDFSVTPFTHPPSRRFQFDCRGEFDEGYYVRCTNCGNCWDGNAQCMCILDEDTEII